MALPITKSYKPLLVIWTLFSLICIVWLIGNIATILSPESTIAKLANPTPPSGGWQSQFAGYLYISLWANILLSILFCFITFIGLSKRKSYALFTGYISLSAATFSNIVYNVAVSNAVTMNLLFSLQVAAVIIIEIIALIYLIKYTSEVLKIKKL